MPRTLANTTAIVSSPSSTRMNSRMDGKKIRAMVIIPMKNTEDKIIASRRSAFTLPRSPFVACLLSSFINGVTRTASGNPRNPPI